MLILKIENNKTGQIKSSGFRNEKELQNLIDNNLEDIFGIRHIAQEVSTDSGKIDSLGLDEDNAPIIVEYKWGEQDEAIIQALSYLNWLVNHKWEVEKIIKNKIGEKVKIEWGQPKVIVVAQSFSKRVRELEKAILQFGESIEEKPTKFYIGYWHNRIFCKIRFRKGKLRISIYTKALELSDPRKLAKPSNKSWEGSTEYYYFSISKPKDTNYALDLIKQSYKST